MVKSRVFLSSATLCGWGFGLPYRLAFRFLKRYGFDGIEILLTYRAIRTHRRLVRLAGAMGLEATFHRWWNDPFLASNILTRVGVFPKRGVRLRDVLPPDFSLPVVVSSYHWQERRDLPHIRIQPACTGYPEDVMPLEELLQKIKAEGTSLVFDVMHWLEYEFGRTAMPDNPKKLLHAAVEGFRVFQQQIAEIHIYDFRLQIGPAAEIRGSKLFPGDGIFPVLEFLREITSSSWRGQITWEINPVLIATKPWYVRRLKQLPQLVRGVGL